MDSHRTAPTSRLRFRDVISLGLQGNRRRGGRTALSVLGVALGAAAVVAVLGVSASSETALLNEISQLSSVLDVSITPGPGAGQISFPAQALVMAQRIGPVVAVGGTADLNVNAYRTNLIPSADSNALAVVAADSSLLIPLGGKVLVGQFLDGAHARLPDAVLGSLAAQRLGINELGVRIWIGNTWFFVVGILSPVAAAPQIDDSVLVGLGSAATYFDYHSGYTSLFVRASPGQVDAVATVLPPTVDPAAPSDVQVVEASSLLTVGTVAQSTLGTLVLLLGAISFGVGGLGVANTMIVSVFERRVEIAVRRTLGARRKHVSFQFLIEAAELSVAGGVLGTLVGLGVTLSFCVVEGWAVSFPWYALAAPIAGSLVVGVVAGAYPSFRASSIAPSEVLRTV